MKRGCEARVPCALSETMVIVIGILFLCPKVRSKSDLDKVDSDSL